MKPKPTARAEHVARLGIGPETLLVPRKGQAKAKAKASLAFTEETDILVPGLIRHRRDSSTRPRSRISEA